MKAVSNARWTDDPFVAACMPPPDETDDQRAKRVHEEAEAVRVSREIDESLQEARKLIEKRKKATKVLLLGKLIRLSPHAPHPFRPKANPSLARARLSRVSAQILRCFVIPLLMIGVTDHRLSTLLLPFSIQARTGCLEIGHSAQSHQVILSSHTPRAFVPFSCHSQICVHDPSDHTGRLGFYRPRKADISPSWVLTPEWFHRRPVSQLQRLEDRREGGQRTHSDRRTSASPNASLSPHFDGRQSYQETLPPPTRPQRDIRPWGYQLEVLSSQNCQGERSEIRTSRLITRHRPPRRRHSHSRYLQGGHHRTLERSSRPQSPQQTKV